MSQAYTKNEPSFSWHEASKFLGIGSKTLVKILKQQKIINNYKYPYETYIQRGYFKVEHKKFINRYDQEESYTQTRVTPHGIDWLRKNLKGNQPDTSEIATRLKNAKQELLQLASYLIQQEMNGQARTLQTCATELNPITETLESVSQETEN